VNRTFELHYTEKFQKDAKSLDSASRKHLEHVIGKLLEDPHRFKPLKGYPLHYRLRFEKYRLIYKVEGEKITLMLVRKRDEAYRTL